jgi:hypothetical protein
MYFSGKYVPYFCSIHQNALNYCLIKIKIYAIIIFSLVLCGCESWSLLLGEKRRLRVFENKVLMRIYVSKREEVTGNR